MFSRTVGFVLGAAIALSSGSGIVAQMIQVESLDADATPIKGNPFCAEIKSENTHVLADGNRIHTTDDSRLCRDSEGRTRRDVQLKPLPKSSGQKIVTIVDPVAGLRYTLDTKAKIAHRTPLPVGTMPSLAPGTGGWPAGFYAKSGASELTTYVPNNKMAPNVGEPQRSTESLGDQTIAGVHARGTRVTTTIPAETMGNEQPITVTSEDWYSPELKVTVMTKLNDPRGGELSTRFTSVNASEPDRSLFTVPGGYRVLDEKPEPLMIELAPQGSSSAP
jgi:hypothetical protein